MPRRIIIIIGLLLAGLACERNYWNPSDSWSSYYSVESKAFVQRIDSGSVLAGSTVRLRGGVTSSLVEEDGLVQHFRWDIDGDGLTDTSLSGTDTLAFRTVKPEKRVVRIELEDALGHVSSAGISVDVLGIGEAWALPEFALTVDTLCAFYVQDERSMRAVLLFCQFVVYRNKTESMEIGAFVYDILKNLLGSADPLLLLHPHQTGFSDGVYVFDNGSLSLQCVFHYGTSFSSHSENDTIRHNLFSLDSYVRNLSPSSSSPYYSFDQGPLYELVDNFGVDVSNPLDPKASFDVDFTSLKFSCDREVETNYTMSADLGVDSTGRVRPYNPLTPGIDAMLFDYFGKASVAPFRLGELNHLLNVDSVVIDLSNSKISTGDLPFRTIYTIDGRTDTAFFTMNLTQTMIEQFAYYGNSGGNNKASGNYFARSLLTGEDIPLAKSFFDGQFSSSVLDTATFYCDSLKSIHLGDLFFDVPDTSSFTFNSTRYNYQFEMKKGYIIR